MAANKLDSSMLEDDAVTDAKLANGAVTNIKLATGIDATKLADGTITNSELQYINSLSSNAQTQITAAGNKILQVVHDSTTTNYTVGASAADVTDHNLTITPISSLSSILLLTRTHVFYAGGDSGLGLYLRRTVGASNTDIYGDGTAYTYYGETGATNRRVSISLNYEDTNHLQTSAITYQVRANKNSGTIHLNTDSVGSITAFEIGA